MSLHAGTSRESITPITHMEFQATTQTGMTIKMELKSMVVPPISHVTITGLEQIRQDTASNKAFEKVENLRSFRIDERIVNEHKQKQRVNKFRMVKKPRSCVHEKLVETSMAVNTAVIDKI